MLALLSCEASAFIVFIITVDRFLVLRFPFSQNTRLGQSSAQIVCAVTWLVSGLLAAAPIVRDDWLFYQQSGLCLPLLVTRHAYPGRDYALGVMGTLNAVLFLLTAIGQGVVYVTIRANSLVLADTSRSQSSASRDLAVARRLVTIAVSNFLCWFPVGLLGLLAACGVTVPGDVSVATAIFALPLNSALNPFLYTINVIRERRERAQFLRLQALYNG
jgi:hypothetical protein